MNTVSLFAFRKRHLLPRVSDLTPEQKAALYSHSPDGPGDVVHLEYIEHVIRGESIYLLYCWLLGARKPLRWSGPEGTWKEVARLGAKNIYY